MMAVEQSHPIIAAGDHQAYMEYALEQAHHSPPAPTKFCVGAVLVDADKNEILSTGWSLELPDNNPADPGKTHAEQCCLIKISQKNNLPEERLGEVLPKNTVLYTTMEPCNKRLSGNKPCVDRILGLKGAIKAVYIGIKEPENFIDQSVLVVGRKRLQEAGIEVTFVEGMEDRILEVSTAGMKHRCGDML
jgi:pyrimidine deaminase RibD-like protein